MIWTEDTARKANKATDQDGAYLLRTHGTDLTDDETWRTYKLLTRAESAFRAIKSPQMERPIWNHRKQRAIYSTLPIPIEVLPALRAWRPAAGTQTAPS